MSLNVRCSLLRVVLLVTTRYTAHRLAGLFPFLTRAPFHLRHNDRHCMCFSTLALGEAPAGRAVWSQSWLDALHGLWMECIAMRVWPLMQVHCGYDVALTTLFLSKDTSYTRLVMSCLFNCRKPIAERNASEKKGSVKIPACHAIPVLQLANLL